MRLHLLPFLALAACSHNAPPASGAGESSLTATSTASSVKVASKPTKRPLEERVSELHKEALASRDAVDFVRAITRDVGHRLAGSPNDAKAVQWAEKRLVAGGFTSVHRESVMVTRWERGAASGSIVSKGKRAPLDLLALGRSGSTPPGGIEAPVVRVETLAAAEALGRKELEGKILFLDVAMPRERDGSGYAHAAPTRYRGSQVAHERGAVAMIVRSLSPNPSVPHTGTTGQVGSVSVAVSGTSADALRDTLARDPKAKVHLESSAKTLPDVESFNVVGDIRGTERPDEVVLLGAHLDSWDVGEGASDDGAGCAIVTEAARLAAKYAPRRTIRVVLFASEELGGAPGATGYAKAHAAEADKFVAAIEADAGEGRSLGFRANSAPDRVHVVQRLESFLAPLGVDPSPGEAHPGVDVEPLMEKGVPILQLRQDMSAYFDVHHTKLDVFERIDQASLTQTTAAYAVLAYATAELDETLGRAPVKAPSPH
ncbi:M28 family peptidase [Pendulispora albinea]|uniref:Carboxypeptidase Q n=1 Tax=Pendulispora albinea TaxID=2741071 RepID=A0ABZ2LNZ1_9BACT